MYSLLITMIIVHLSICVLYTIKLISKYENAYLFCCLIILYSLPIAGAILIYRFDSIPKNKSAQGTVNSKSGSEAASTNTYQSPLLAIDFMDEVDISPASEMLNVADYCSRRRFVLDILKTTDSSFSDLRQVRTALQNEDQETVHYAASGLQHISHVMEKNMAELENEIQFQPNNLKLLENYADTINDYLQIIRPGGADRQRLEHKQIIQLLRLMRAGRVDRADRLIELMRNLGHERLARTISRRMFCRTDETEHKYMALMKYYFSIRDKNGFELALNSLRKSEIVISEDALNLIRLWTGVMK